MNKNFLWSAVLFGTAFLLLACGLGSHLNSGQQPTSSESTTVPPILANETTAPAQATPTMTSVQPTPTSQVLDQSIEAINQQIDSLLATLQSPENSAPTVAATDDSLNQLNSFQQTVQAIPTP